MFFKKIGKIIEAFRYLINDYELHKNDAVSRSSADEEETLKMEDIIPAMKNVDPIELFERARPGDVIVATSNNSLKKLANIKPGHRTRPYIVARKEKDFIRAYSGSSNANSKYPHAFRLLKKEYNVSKDGTINIGDCATVMSQCIVSIVDHLKEKDILTINEVIFTNRKKDLCQLIETDGCIQEKTVVRNDEGLFYIYSLDGEGNGILYKLTEEHVSGHGIVHNGRKYYISVKDPEERNVGTGFIQVNCSKTEDVEKYIGEYRFSSNIRHISVNKYHKECDYRYPIGQQFAKGHERYVYLFTCNGNDFGVNDDEVLDDDLSVIKLGDLGTCIREEVLDEDTLDYVLYSLSSRYYQYAWMRNLLADTNCIS